MTARRLTISDGESFTTLAALELSSIAQGIRCVDAILKEAPVRVLLAEPASPGKYLVLFTGAVSEAARSLARGIELAADARVDDVLLPAAHEDIIRLLKPRGKPRRSLTNEREQPALGILETYSAAGLLGATDTALKTGETWLLEIHLLAGIGGKATALIGGDVESVRVAIESGAAFAAERGVLAHDVVIPRPDPLLAELLTQRSLDGSG
ncbi:MAG: BMC domain-containing protein [Planctomycetota bacterium]